MAEKECTCTKRGGGLEDNLLSASNEGHSKCVEKLISNPDYEYTNFNRVLHAAIKSGCSKTVEQLQVRLMLSGG